MGQTHNAGDRARIISPLQAPSAGGACLSFWYHMSGINIDRFAVYLRADDSDSIVFTRTGTQGDEWIRGEKTIQMDTAWQVGREEVKGLWQMWCNVGVVERMVYCWVMFGWCGNKGSTLCMLVHGWCMVGVIGRIINNMLVLGGVI